MRPKPRVLPVVLFLATAVSAQEVIAPQPPLVHHWESVPPTPRVRIREVSEGVTVLSWPSPELVITGGLDQMLTVWSLPALKRLEARKLPHPERVREFFTSLEIHGELDARLLISDLYALGGHLSFHDQDDSAKTLTATTMIPRGLLALGMESGRVELLDLVFQPTNPLIGQVEMGAPVSAVAFAATLHAQRGCLWIGDESGTLARWNYGDEDAGIEPLEGHRGAVNALALDPTATRLASASSDRTVRLWEVASKRPIRVLRGHGSWVSDVTWSPDGRRLLTACYDRVIRLWDATSGQLLHSFTGHGAAVLKVRFSPDGKRFASIGNDDTLRVWEIPDGPQVEIDRGHTKDVFFVAFSPDGKHLASGSGDHTVRIWAVSHGVCLRVLHGHSDAVNHVAWSPDGRFIASASTDGTARLWDAKTGEALAVMRGHRARLTACDFHPTEPRLATGAGDFTIKEWAVPSGELIRTLRGHLGASKNVVYSPDGRYISSGGGDGSVILWDADSGEVAKKLRAPHSYDHCHSVAFNPQATLMAAGYLGYAVRLFDVEGGTQVTTLEGHTASVEAITLSPDGQTLASASGDRTVRLWDLRSFAEIRRLEGHAMTVYAASWSPDGTMIATCSADRSIKLWQSHTGRLIRSLPATSGAVRALADGPVTGTEDGWVRIWPRSSLGPLAIRAHRGPVTALATSDRQVISGGADGAVRIWDRKSGEMIDDLDAELPTVESLALSPDGGWIAACDGGPGISLWSRRDDAPARVLQDPGVAVRALCFVGGEPGMLAAGCRDGTLRLWSLESSLRVRLLEPRGGRINALASQGRMIATATDDGAIRVFDAESGTLIRCLRGHRGPILDVAFIGGGRIASVSRDQTARIWPHPTREGDEEPQVFHLPTTPTAVAAEVGKLAVGLTSGDVWLYRGAGLTTDTLSGLDQGLWVRWKNASAIHWSSMWRGDDGGRVLWRDRPQDEARPMARQGNPLLEVSSRPNRADRTPPLAVAAPRMVVLTEAGPGADLTIDVYNHGPGEALQLRVVERSAASGFLVWPHQPVVRLKSKKAARIPVTISHLHLGSGELKPGGPYSFRKSLELAVVDGRGREIPFFIVMDVEAPQPELRDLEVHRDRHGHVAGLGFQLANEGKVDTGALAVHVEFLRADTRERLGFSEDSDQLYALEPGTKEGPLMFSVPAELHHADFPLAFRLFLDADAWPSLSWISEHEVPQAGR